MAPRPSTRRRHSAPRPPGPAEEAGALGELLDLAASFDAARALAGPGGPLPEALAALSGQLDAAIARCGVQEIAPRQGDRFDPACHEAVAVSAAQDGEEPGRIVRALTRGFRDGRMVLRAARVEVSS